MAPHTLTACLLCRHIAGALTPFAAGAPPPRSPCSLWDTYTQSWLNKYDFYPNRHSGGYHCHSTGTARRCYSPRTVRWEWASTLFVNAKNCGPGCIMNADIPLDVAGGRRRRVMGVVD